MKSDPDAFLPPDYHVHTARCGHASGRAADYVEEALRLGLPGIGISDHLPLLEGRDPQLAMEMSELGDYVAEVLELKARYPGYVFLGIEADYRPGTTDRLSELLDAHPFDYVIGSVHSLDGWGFDDPRQRDGFAGRDIDYLYEQYLELVAEAAESGLFTILGHVDLVKKWGHRPTRDLGGAVENLALRIARTGVAVEVNTAGLRKPVGEIYPSESMLRALAAQQVPLVFGSDAHRPGEVGAGFDEALQMAWRAGFRSHLVLGPGLAGSGRGPGVTGKRGAAWAFRALPEVS